MTGTDASLATILVKTDQLGGWRSTTSTDIGAKLAVTAKEITIDPTDASQFTYSITEQTYDGDTAVDAAVLTMHVDGKDIAVNWTNGAFNSRNVADVSTATFSGLISSDTNYTITNTSLELGAAGKILAKDLSVNANAQTLIYGADANVQDYTVMGWVSGDEQTDIGAMGIDNASRSGAGKLQVGQAYSFTGTALNAGTNYNVQFTSATVTVNARTLTNDVTFDHTKVYDGTGTVNNISGDLTNAVTGDDITLTKGFEYNSKNVATADKITATAWSISGADSGNYILETFADVTADITKRDLTITATDITNHTYGTAYTLAYTNTTLGTGDKFAGELTIDPADTDKSQSGNYNVGDHTIVRGTLNVVDGSGNDMSGNYNIAFNNGTLNIAKATIEVATVTIADKTYDGTTSGTLTDWTFNSSVANADALTLTGTAVFGTKHAGTAKAASVNGFALSGADGGNYNLTESTFNTTATISKADIGIKLNDASKGCGQADPAFTYSITSGELFAGDSIENITREAGEAIGSYAINGYTLNDGNGGNNYNVTSFTPGTLTIKAKVLKISINDTVFTYNGADQFATEYTQTGLETGDTITNITVESVHDAGTYSISATSVKVMNGEVDVTDEYAITYEKRTGNVTVNKAALTVTATAANKTYGEADPELQYTTSGLFGTDTLSGSLEREAGEDVGTYAITQGTLANSNYHISSYTGANLTITAKEITLDPTKTSEFTYDITAQVYDGDTAVDAAALVMHVDGKNITVSWTSGQFNSKNVLDVSTATFTGLESSDGNYTITNASLVLNAAGKILVRNITVTANAQTKVFGTADPALTYQVTDLVAGETLTGALTRETGENVGAYAILQGTLTNENNTNYNIAYTGSVFTITPARQDAEEVTETKEIKQATEVNGDQYSEGLNRNFSCTMESLQADYLADGRHNLPAPFAASFTELVISQEDRTVHFDFTKADRLTRETP